MLIWLQSIASYKNGCTCSSSLNESSWSGSETLGFLSKLLAGSLQALVAAKAQILLGQLQHLGYAEWQAAPAVLRHGSNLESAISFLLEGNCSTEEDARAFIETADCVPDICIDAELDMIAQLSVCQDTPLGGICLSSAFKFVTVCF